MHAASPAYLFNTYPTWTVVYWVSFFLFFAITSWVQRRERGGPRGDLRDRGSKPLIYIASFAGAAAAFAAPAFLPWARIDLPPGPLFITAMTMFWAGALLYYWAVQTLGAFFRTSVTLLEGQRLVTRGPYRLLRHPAYSGGILLFAGIGLSIGNWFSAVAAPLSVALAYAWRIHVEEIALRERFGAEFEAQRRRTWAVVPLIW